MPIPFFSKLIFQILVCSERNRHFCREANAPESTIHVGLATFDTSVQFYDLSSPQPKMLIVCKLLDLLSLNTRAFSFLF